MDHPSVIDMCREYGAFLDTHRLAERGGLAESVVSRRGLILSPFGRPSPGTTETSTISAGNTEVQPLLSSGLPSSASPRASPSSSSGGDVLTGGTSTSIGGDETTTTRAAIKTVSDAELLEWSYATQPLGPGEVPGSRQIATREDGTKMVMRVRAVADDSADDVAVAKLQASSERAERDRLAREQQAAESHMEKLGEIRERVALGEDGLPQGRLPSLLDSSD